jgi:cytidylate kinase
LIDRNPNLTIEEVKTNLELRDYTDSHREFSPLRKATDAIELDNTSITRDEQLAIALDWAKGHI